MMSFTPIYHLSFQLFIFNCHCYIHITYELIYYVWLLLCFLHLSVWVMPSYAMRKMSRVWVIVKTTITILFSCRFNYVSLLRILRVKGKGINSESGDQIENLIVNEMNRLNNNDEIQRNKSWQIMKSGFCVVSFDIW